MVEPKKKEEPRKEVPAPPPVAKAIQFNIQGETKRMMASGDSAEFEMSLKVPEAVASNPIACSTPYWAGTFSPATVQPIPQL